MSRGAFIVFEGIDRSGKTTQANLLVENLRKEGKKVQHIRFPDRTTAIGKIIDDFLTKRIEMTDEAIHLLYSANRWEKNYQIKELLEQGITVVCDRYVYSGVVFAVAKGYDLDWSMAPDRGLVEPDKVFLMKITPDVAQSRLGFGEERYEVVAFQQKVVEAYDSICWPKQEEVGFWCDIDANQSVEMISKKICFESLLLIDNIDSPLTKIDLP